MARAQFISAAAALVVSSLLIIPATDAAAQGWTTNIYNRLPIVQGNGQIVRQSRPVGAFNRISTAGSEEVIVQVGPRPSLVIAADSNILPMLETRVRNGLLTVESRGSYRMRGPIRMWITVPALTGYETSGSGNVRINGVNSDRLKLTINGSSSILATGRVNRLDVDINGSGDARLAALAATDVHAGLYGSGEATVRAANSLDADIYGSGDVRYVTRPRIINVDRVGSGGVGPAR